ncbi:hypothetical protein Tco_0374172 [Tanacetum coccineum]
MMGLLQCLLWSYAVNLVDRSALPYEVRVRCPSIYLWVDFLYGQATRLYIGDTHIWSASGVQQGDPLGPLIFALVLHPLVHKIRDSCKLLLHAWYLNDGTVIGDSEEHGWIPLGNMRFIVKSSRASNTDTIWLGTFFLTYVGVPGSPPRRKHPRACLMSRIFTDESFDVVIEKRTMSNVKELEVKGHTNTREMEELTIFIKGAIRDATMPLHAYELIQADVTISFKSEDLKEVAVLDATYVDPQALCIERGASRKGAFGLFAILADLWLGATSTRQVLVLFHPLGDQLLNL